jgi:hypothetical protein
MLKAFIILLFLGLNCNVSAESDDFKRCRTFAERGDALAQFFMGLHYYQGFDGVVRDKAEAAKWWRLSADQGQPDAESAIGDMYYKGDFLAQDYEESFKWYLRSAMHGNSNAAMRVGTFYLSGQGGVTKNLKYAHAWLSIYTPSEEKFRDLQRKHLLLIESKLDANDIAQARIIKSQLLDKINSNTK